MRRFSVPILLQVLAEDGEEVEEWISQIQWGLVETEDVKIRDVERITNVTLTLEYHETTPDPPNLPSVKERLKRLYDRKRR